MALLLIVEEADIRNRIKNKMIRPTTIPQLLEDLKLGARYSKRGIKALAFEQHKALAVGLKGYSETEGNIRYI